MRWVRARHSRQVQSTAGGEGVTMRTALYCRVSTPGQKNTTSLPEQERINRAHAAQLAWEVSEPHVYREVEGGEDLYRPCMDRLWDAIMAHEVEAVVIDVLDRLSRDEGDVGAFYHHADRHGVTVELASEDIDESEQGRTMRAITGIMGRMERADIRRRTQRGRKAHVAAGKMLVGTWQPARCWWARGRSTATCGATRTRGRAPTTSSTRKPAGSWYASSKRWPMACPSGRSCASWSVTACRPRFRCCTRAANSPPSAPSVTRGTAQPFSACCITLPTGVSTAPIALSTRPRRCIRRTPASPARSAGRASGIPMTSPAW